MENRCTSVLCRSSTRQRAALRVSAARSVSTALFTRIVQANGRIEEPMRRKKEKGPHSVYVCLLSYTGWELIHDGER
ncbi:hypothetical protein R1flu_003506 [Riccia fluitans]|uniref:Uncharacterized protein n=1 Tax=Riccia fluitans TaxID=41844 RepID=A0ABD1Y978_9MARC